MPQVFFCILFNSELLGTLLFKLNDNRLHFKKIIKAVNLNETTLE